ncbi:Phosphate regulon sensor protein PhoR (SphS) [Coxiella-like endosymbiont]|uniref:ATP-binding protein n=1 Tax=Coxiella endosymbiont of Rhipicephalus microplus TaxID=1656186 RepID=UPI000C8106CF|nr:ATP-binding protein [Coxiella endosymbiont of Rhipicephalus microplus]PMB54371.1 Phosphate regulon sensor protein PhoR (SphS) [Coxiella-like endosymbiont]
MIEKSNKLNLTTLPKAVREHINQLERIRRDFVGNVSHELRTPLTVIRGYLETLLKKKNSEIKCYQKIFSQMYQYSSRMEATIDDLLLLSRLESDDHPPKEKVNVSVYEILKILCADAKRISAEKQHRITLEADTNLYVNGSEEELKSLFSNIIINAVKYTLAKGRIHVKWYSDDNHLVFSVSDTGIGIAKEHIPRITERFYRIDQARSRESGGTGLGLAIVKHVLMRHQGDLHIESEPGQGSTFTCRFPH